VKADLLILDLCGVASYVEFAVGASVGG